MVAVACPSLVHKGQTSSHVSHPYPGYITQTELLNRARLGELINQPPLYKLTLASFCIWHCDELPVPPHTFLLRVCHRGALTEFLLTGDSQNHVQI